MSPRPFSERASDRMPLTDRKSAEWMEQPMRREVTLVKATRREQEAAGRQHQARSRAACRQRRSRVRSGRCDAGDRRDGTPCSAFAVIGQSDLDL